MAMQIAPLAAPEANVGSGEARHFLSRPGFESRVDEWQTSKPFSHIVFDDFLRPEVLDGVVAEFPNFDDTIWYSYDNAIEIKKVMNNWDRFGPATYRLFTFFNSPEFVKSLEVLTGCPLYPDCGLNGAGLHSHRQGGKLNTHLDYSIHPKLGLERRLNLLIYATPNWNPEWGGDLGLWEHDPNKKAPGKLAKSISPLYNRAVLFDTTQNSWHGLPEPITCPAGVRRNSIALYYLCTPRQSAETRGRALFVPYKDQANDPEILELIRKRSSVTESISVYRK